MMDKKNLNIKIDNLDEEEQENLFLTFNIEDESYGIKISSINEIINMFKITQIPEVPEYIKGVINLRGQVIPVIDVRLRFGKEEIDYTETTCTIVVIHNNNLIGLIVDSVDEVVQINEENIEKMESSEHEAKTQFIYGLGKVEDSVKIILSLETLLSREI